MIIKCALNEVKGSSFASQIPPTDGDEFSSNCVCPNEISTPDFQLCVRLVYVCTLIGLAHRCRRTDAPNEDREDY